MVNEHYIEYYIRGEDEMYFDHREKCTCAEGLDHRQIRND